MKRSRFLQKYPALYPALRKVLKATGLDNDEAEDVLSISTNRLLAKKTYSRIQPNNLRGFLVQHVQYASREYKKDRDARRMKICTLPDDAESVPVEIVESKTEVILCPFCHTGELNMYAACKACHTILPTSATIHRKVLRMDEVSLAVDFEYDKQLDVHRALSQLSDREQTVVKAVVMGEESLASLAALTGLSGMTLQRTWMTAKQKLQCILHAYSPEHCPKRPQQAFRRALNAAPVA